MNWTLTLLHVKATQLAHISRHEASNEVVPCSHPFGKLQIFKIFLFPFATKTLLLLIIDWLFQCRVKRYWMIFFRQWNFIGQYNCQRRRNLIPNFLQIPFSFFLSLLLWFLGSPFLFTSSLLITILYDNTSLTKFFHHFKIKCSCFQHVS